MKKWTLVLVLTLISAVTVNAAIQPNDREFSVSGRYTHTPDNSHNDAGGGGIEVSQYCDNNISVGLQGWVNFGNDGDDTVVGINAKYHCSPSEDISPYVGAQINYAMLSTTDYSVDSDRSTDGMLWGPIVGVAFKCADKSSLFVQYEWQLYQGGIRDSGIKEGHAVVIGMSWGF